MKKKWLDCVVRQERFKTTRIFFPCFLCIVISFLIFFPPIFPLPSLYLVGRCRRGVLLLPSGKQTKRIYIHKIGTRNLSNAHSIEIHKHLVSEPPLPTDRPTDHTHTTYIHMKTNFQFEFCRFRSQFDDNHNCFFSKKIFIYFSGFRIRLVETGRVMKFNRDKK